MPRTALDTIRHGSSNSEIRECANCGTKENLMRCGRCHTVWFCGVKCQKAYWPFHKLHCHRNEFADQTEESEPKFAAWMRKHGKMAVLKDDEVDRLERASTAVSGPTRQSVMESMYGRLNPKPADPTFTNEEMLALKQREEKDKINAYQAEISGRCYAEVVIPPNLGIETSSYKWHQTQSLVEIFIPLPEGTRKQVVDVILTTTELRVIIDGRNILTGKLYREIKAESSTWYMQEGVLEIVLLKRHRRGHYESGETNATTFWHSILRGAPEFERLDGPPPASYYETAWDGEDDESSVLVARQRTRAMRKTPHGPVEYADANMSGKAKVALLR